ncbi:hypothetical protein Nepgr_002526 [Nepenthes gracilis]|uniref:Uncharacterized protein n=1 Tax=Nepenthes gracilis TaxID=150966 RepID=A0AAD3P779_NEPGR|nr:hypothetical protein Nepgr_002526 [Nepenthes gracilis]
MSTVTAAGEKHKQVEAEVREMVTSMTTRLSDLHKSASNDGGERGLRIITLSGSNVGATMRKNEQSVSGDEQREDEWGLGTYVNSNFQAINNSIMMGGSYGSNDPGVHLDISDAVEQSQVQGQQIPDEPPPQHSD